MRIENVMLPVRKATRARIKYLKGDTSYEAFISSLCNDYERKNLSNRFSLRSEK
jgi:hypothetical protein